MQEFILASGPAPTLGIDYRAELNDEQYAVVTEGEGRCLVLAGAGSGKTRAVTYRVAWLLEHGVPPEEILLLTFTNKAAKEMVSRVEALLKHYPTGLWAGTFHSIANRLLRQLGSHHAFGSNFSILDEDDAQDLIKLCVKEVAPSKGSVRFPSASVIKSVLSYALNARLTIDAVLERRHPALLMFSSELTQIAARYREQKLRAQALDFDDLLVVLLELLQADPTLCARLSGRYKYVLVDEFQDTNSIQAELVDLLSSAHQNLLVVGDDAQSIYSFRAAEIKNILDFPRRYEGAKTLRLLTNYRSTPQILAVANAVIKNNSGQFEKDLIAAAPAGDKPLLVPAADERQEAQYVAEQILTYMNAGQDLSGIAVLFRAAFHSQALEFELMKRDIPYEYRGGQKFFERAHIKDALAHLRVLRNHRDQMAWLRILQLHEGIGLAGASKLTGQITTTDSLESALAHVQPTGSKAAAAWSVIKVLLTSLSQKTSPAAMLRTLSASDFYQAYLAAEYQNSRERLEDLEQFAIFAEQYEVLGLFLDAIILTGDFGARADDLENTQASSNDLGDRLILSTVHQAKGLEWHTVFILNLAEGAFPHGRAYGEEGGMEEERRLFYVAATRARRQLIFSYPLTSGYHDIEIKHPSPFLTEIPSQMLEEVKLRTARPTYAPAYASAAWGGRAASSGPSAPIFKQTSYNLDPFADDDEPTIVLDDSGESVGDQKPRGSFLGDY
jgi:DNA helicase-2/ATP-dependent DNA helicase PcrA